jgi:tetratricopeptide (TPR) repeat protein
MSRQKNRKELKKKTKAKSVGHKAGGGNRPRGKLMPVNYPSTRRAAMAAQNLQRKMNRAEQLMSKGEYEPALDLVEEVLDDAPDNAPALGLSAYLYGQLGMPQDSLERAEMALQKMPDEPLLLNLIFTAYLQMSHTAHALQTLRRMNRLNINDEEIFNQQHRNFIVELEKDFARLAQEAGLEPAIYEQAMLQTENSQLGLIKSDIDEAVEHARQAVELAPNWPIARNNLVFMLSQKGEGKEALEKARQAVESFPQDFNALNNLGLLLGLAGKAGEVEELKPRLLESFKQQVEKLDDELESPLYSSLAMTLGAAEDDNGIYDLFKSKVETETGPNADHLRYLGAAAWNLGHTQEARQHWARIEENELNSNDLAILAEVDRPRPPEAEPYRVPFLDMDDLLPTYARTKMIIADETDGGRSLKAEEMRAGYNELAPYYPVAKALTIAMTLGNPILAGVLAKVMLTIDAPELVQAAKDFALGYQGARENREEVVAELIEAGYLPEEGRETIRFWSEEAQIWEELFPAAFTEVDD